MIEYSADQKVTPPKRVLAIGIPKGLVQFGMIILILFNTLFVVWLAQPQTDITLKFLSGLGIGAVTMFTFIIYRTFLKWIWEVKE